MIPRVAHMWSKRRAPTCEAAVENFFAEMALRYEDLPKQLQIIARFVESNRACMATMRITTIAAMCGAQPSAVTRFAKRFGFSGFGELHTLFREDLNASMGSSRNYATRALRPFESPSGGTSVGGILRQVLLANLRAIDDFALKLDHCSLVVAATALRVAEHIYVVAAGWSLAAAIFLTYLLQSTSKPVHLVNGSDGRFVGQVLSMRSGDVLVAISFAPYNHGVCECLRIGAARGAKVLAITDSVAGLVARSANIRLFVSEASTRSFGSLTNTMCLCQALFIAMASGRTRYGRLPIEPDPEEAE